MRLKNQKSSNTCKTELHVQFSPDNKDMRKGLTFLNFIYLFFLLQSTLTFKWASTTVGEATVNAIIVAEVPRPH